MTTNATEAVRPPPVTVFYSYAHEDEPLRDDLQDHLKILERRGLLAPWHDRRIVPGDAWDRRIDEHLRQAELILLLVSKSFIGSDYIFGTELEVAMQRHRAAQATVVPIIVRSVDLDPEDADALPFLALQGLPTDLRPVTSWPNVDEAWTDVARGLRATVKAIIERRAARPARPAAAPADPAAAAAGGAAAMRPPAHEPQPAPTMPASSPPAVASPPSPSAGWFDRALDRLLRFVPGSSFVSVSGFATAPKTPQAPPRLPASPPAEAPAASAAPAEPAEPDPVLERVVERFSEAIVRASLERGGDAPEASRLREQALGLIDRRDAPRLLWVDDHPEGNAGEAAALARLQVEIAVATSTAEAQRLLDAADAAAAGFDLVVSDWERRGEPPAAGLALLDWLRGRRPALPVVFYHGEFDAGRRAARARLAREHGAFGEAVLPGELLALVLQALPPRTAPAAAAES